MAAYTITQTEVTAGAGATISRTALAGVTITAGQALYLSAANTVSLAQADGTAAEAAAVGIAMNGGAAGQPILFVANGLVNLDTAALTGAALGDVVALGATAGGLYPNEDIATTEYVTIMGYIVTANPGVVNVSIIATGVAHV